MSEPLFQIAEPPEPRFTERAVLDLLGKRYSQRHGNGPRYAIAEHVRSQAGFDARRCADLIVMDLWPSKGLHLIGHEVKVSRSDWLAELRDPSKADEFRPYMNQWYLVAPPGVVRDDLPDGWGLIEVRDSGTNTVVPSPKSAAEPMPKSMLAGLLRATAKTAGRSA